MDDFKDKVDDSEDDYEDKDLKKGRMNEEMVNALHFGGGEEAGDPATQKKTREERHAEIMEKSKAFKFHAQEIKLANAEYTRQLDEDWNDVAKLLTFKVKDSD